MFQLFTCCSILQFFNFLLLPPALAPLLHLLVHAQGGAGISHFELADLCLACARCGWDCAASVGTDDGGGSGGLSVHVGVGCGRVSCFHVGGDRLGWQLVVSGELFEDQVRMTGFRSPEAFVSSW